VVKQHKPYFDQNERDMFSLLATLVSLVASVVIVLSGWVSFREKISLSGKITSGQEKKQIHKNAKKIFVLIIAGAFLAAIGAIITEEANVKAQKEKKIADGKIDSFQRRVDSMTVDISIKTDSLNTLTDTIIKMSGLLSHKQDLLNKAIYDLSRQTSSGNLKEQGAIEKLIIQNRLETLNKMNDDSLFMLQTYKDVDGLFKARINSINQTTDTIVFRQKLLDLTENILEKLSLLATNSFLKGHSGIKKMWDTLDKDYNTVRWMLTSNNRNAFGINVIAYSFSKSFQNFERNFLVWKVRHKVP
jgi:hypothetical protein